MDSAEGLLSAASRATDSIIDGRVSIGGLAAYAIGGAACAVGGVAGVGSAIVSVSGFDLDNVGTGASGVKAVADTVEDCTIAAGERF